MPPAVSLPYYPAHLPSAYGLTAISMRRLIAIASGLACDPARLIYSATSLAARLHFPCGFIVNELT